MAKKYSECTQGRPPTRPPNTEEPEITRIGAYIASGPAPGGPLSGLLPVPYSEATSVSKKAISVRAFATAIDLGVTRVYEEIKLGRVKILKSGKRTLIPITELEAFLARLAESIGKRG